MKFFESMYGELVNVEEISKVTIESNEVSDKYYSYVYLKNGEKIDFIELPTSLPIDDTDKTRQAILGEAEYLFMIKRALEFIIESISDLVSNKYIKEHSHNCLMSALS